MKIEIQGGEWYPLLEAVFDGELAIQNRRHNYLEQGLFNERRAIEVPDDVALRYHRIQSEWYDLQHELGKLSGRHYEDSILTPSLDA